MEIAVKRGSLCFGNKTPREVLFPAGKKARLTMVSRLGWTGFIGHFYGSQDRPRMNRMKLDLDIRLYLESFIYRLENKETLCFERNCFRL